MLLPPSLEKLIPEEYGSSRFPKCARTSVEKFQLVVLMNFQKTEKSRSKKNDCERKQASRKDKKMDDSSQQKTLKIEFIIIQMF